MENRITELEIKTAYLEDTIQQLDSVICQQQKQIDAFKKQFKQLTESLENPSESNKDHLSALVNEAPPHY